MGRVVNLSENDSLMSQYISEIRDVTVQTDRLRFRKNLERIASIAAYEISKTLRWESREIQTPLASTSSRVLAGQPLVANILRAGMPMHMGLLHFFDQADNAFISAYRKHDEKGNFFIELEYLSCPELDDRVLIVADPMLATGSSMALTIKALLKIGTPSKIHIVCAIASKQGLEHVLKVLPDVEIWTGAIDDELNDKSYIVPGLGDAGDLAFGTKIQF
jgi:uracil phosphoribosyltransferase